MGMRNPAIKKFVEMVGGFRQAADHLEVSVAAVRHWDRGIRRPSPACAEKIEMITGGAISRSQVIWPERSE